MQVIRGCVVSVTSVVVVLAGTVGPAGAQTGPGAAPIDVRGGGDRTGIVNTVVIDGGMTDGVRGGARLVGKSSGGNVADRPPFELCQYTRTPELDDPGPPVRQAYRRNCLTEDTGNILAPQGDTVFLGGGVLPPQVTPGQLAQRAADTLSLPEPTVQRSPDETIRFEGDPMTWVNLWTWFWTDRAAFQPMTQTVSATVTATPVGLLFDPGDGSAPVRCAGPGRAWVERDGNAAPPAGCGYRYRSVTDGTITSTVSILWDVTWAGSSGLSGALPQMRTQASAPLRVMQVQVVNS